MNVFFYVGVIFALRPVFGNQNVLNKLLREHAEGIAKKVQEIGLDSAWEIVHRKHNSSALEFLDVHLHPRDARKLRRFTGSQLSIETAPQNTGYSAVDSAMNMLNSMIFEAESKYETELERCCTFDKSQSSLMEETRQAISLANQKAAGAKKDILENRAGVTLCETQIPKLKAQLHEWVAQCEFETTTLDNILNTVRSDVDVIGGIINVSNCDGDTGSKVSGFMLYDCKDECGSYQTAGTGKPMTPRMQALALKFLAQTEAQTEQLQTPTGGSANMTTTSPGPRTMTRSRPCKAPRTMDPMSSKCTISNTPQCGPLVEKFSAIMTGLIETQRQLEVKRKHLVDNCEDTRGTLESQIEAFEMRLKDYNTGLADATAMYASASEQSRLKGAQLKEFMRNYEEMTVECHANYEQLETEICALTKIRGDVWNKLKGTSTVPAFFTDCKVTEWIEVEPGCSVSCGGGNVKLARTIEVYPVGGASCPDLEMVTTCNMQKCHVDCRVGDWSGWSDCSTKCGGGVQDRNRPVLVEAMYGGEACGEVEEVQSCNPQSCDVDCVLSDWTVWSNCSKSCNQGHSSRVRTVLEPAIGDGNCPGIDGAVRLQKEVCNPQPCIVLASKPLLHCQTKSDVVILIDGSGSVRQEGWDLQLNATRMLIKAIDPQPDGNQVAVIVYSGPKYLCDYYQCVGYDESYYFRTNCDKKPVSELDCGVDIRSHFTGSNDTLQANLSASVFPSRRTFTSKALAAVESELDMGQKDSQSIVVVMTDGYPEDKESTAAAADKLNKKAKVIWVPITKNAPLKEIRSWATDPENVIPVKRFKDLNMKVINDITATACRELAPVDLFSD